MYKLIVALLLSLCLVGCLSVEKRRVQNIGGIARGFSLYFAEKNAQPESLNEVKALVEREKIKVEWDRVRNISYRPIGIGAVRINYIDDEGEPNYVLVLTSVQGRPNLLNDPTVNLDSRYLILSDDRKLIFRYDADLKPVR